MLPDSAQSLISDLWSLQDKGEISSPELQLLDRTQMSCDCFTSNMPYCHCSDLKTSMININFDVTQTMELTEGTCLHFFESKSLHQKLIKMNLIVNTRSTMQIIFTDLTKFDRID